MEEFIVNKEGYYKSENGIKIYIHFTSDDFSYGVIPGCESQYIYNNDGSLFKYRCPDDTLWTCKTELNHQLFNDLSIIYNWENADPFRLKHV